MANISVSTTATLIVSANTRRQSLIIENEGTATLFIGHDNTVTAANGVAIEEDGNLTETDSGGARMYMGDVYGITSSGTADVRYWERTK